MSIDIPPKKEARDRIGDLLASTRYSPKPDPKPDKHGLPSLAPEPSDPDDE